MVGKRVTEREKERETESGNRRERQDVKHRWRISSQHDLSCVWRKGNTPGSLERKYALVFLF